MNKAFFDFPKISDHFPRISENFPKLFRRSDERSQTFSENFRKFPKIYEDFQKLPRKTRRRFDNTPTNLGTNFISVKSSISNNCCLFRFRAVCVLHYANEESDDVINSSSWTVKYWIKNISRNIKVVFFNLGTRNVHHLR